MFKKRRIVSFVLALCMSVMFFVSCSIIAFADAGDVGKSFVKLKYVLTQLGCLFGGDLDSMISNSEKFQQFSDDKIPVVDDGKGNVTIDNSVVNNIYNVANEELSKQNGYYLLTPAYDLDHVFSTINDVKYSTFLRAQQELKVNYSSAFINNLKSVQFFAPQKQGKIYFYISGNVVFIADEEFNNVPFQRYMFDDNSDVGMTIFTGSYQNYWQWSSFQTQYAGYTTKVFYSFQDLKNYVINGGNFYTTSNFNNFNIYANNSLTINSNTLNNTNWSQTNNNIYQNIYNEYPNVSDDKKQDLIDKKYDDIIGELGDIGGNIDDLKDTMARWLKRIYEKVDAILTVIKNPSVLLQILSDKVSDIFKKLETIGESLANIFNFLYENVGSNFNHLLNKFDLLLKNLEKGFADVVQAIKDIKIDGGGSGVGSGVGSTIGTIIGNLLTEWIKGLLEGALDTGGDLLDAVNSILDNLGTMFAPVADVAKTKFPFSLPWDVYACIKILAAEPETPVFKFDLVLPSYGIDQQLVIDLKDFETISKLSRAFFTLTFVVVLINFTLKITQREDM